MSQAHGLRHPLGSPIGSHEARRPAPSSPVRSPGIDPNIRIKAEVKTEPEYSAGSPQEYRAPTPPKDDAPRLNHPKIKHTDGKDRRPRYPLGPYAPQYGPYGPYAPPPTDVHSQTILNLQSRGLHSDLQRLPPTLHQFHPSIVQNLNAKPAEQSRSPLQRTPPHPGLGPADMHAYPPHYMHMARPPLRPHYAMPLRPERPGHYTQHPGLARPEHRVAHTPPESSQSLPRETVLPVTSPHAKETDVPASERDKPPTPPVDLQKAAPPPPEIAESRLSPPPTAESSKPVERLAFITAEDRAVEKEPEKEAESFVKEPNPPQEGSVFGGLVSYFSSQREDDDIDA